MSTQATLLSVAVSMVCSAALAAPADQPNPPLEEIIVTAQKRSERLLDVPMSIAAISGEQMTAAGIYSTNDLSQITPGLVTVNTGTGFTPSIRGVSSSGTSAGDESNISLYIDDVYVGNTLAGIFDLPDIERIEVLKGPQGTLFGRNATGGAIRMVTRRPSSVMTGSLSADYGFDFAEWKVGAYLAGPLSDSISGSLSGSMRSGDGFVEGIDTNKGRMYAKPDNYMYRGKLLFEPSETFSVLLAADSARNDNAGGALPTARDQNPYPLPGSVPNTPYHYAGKTQPKQLNESTSASADITWSPADWLTVRSITGYRDFDLTYRVDIDRTSVAVSALALAEEQQNFTQEFNFFGPADQKFSWLLGAFYFDSDAKHPYFTSYIGDAPNGVAIAQFAPEVKTTSYAGFADLTWNLTSALHATLGARYTSETKKFHYVDVIRPGGLPLRDVRDEETWTSPTFRGVLRYDLSPDANVYVSLSNGFKSGGYNAFSPTGVSVEPEKIDALEIGAKARLENGLIVAGSVYAYNYDDMQVQSQTQLSGVPLIGLTNAASSEIRGADFTVDGNITEHISFGFGTNYMPTAEYKDYSTASITVPVNTPPIVGQVVAPYDASGSRLVKAPEWTANLRLTYMAELLGGNFNGTLNTSYTGDYNWQAADLTEAPSYTLMNMRLSWTAPNGRYTFSVWGTNLTDEAYSTYTTPNIRGDTQTWNQPRQLGMGFSTNF